MKDGEEVKIELLSGAPRAWLSLHGTVLSYRERFWIRESTVDIPVELVTFTEKKRFKGSRLIAALLPLLYLPAIGGAIIGLWYLFAGSLSNTVMGGCMVVCFLAGFFTFMFLVVRFFIRQRAVTIHVAPDTDDMKIEFWADKSEGAELQELIAETIRRKELVEDTIAYPMRFALGDTTRYPWKQTVFETFLFIIPALITEIPWLLLAGLIPIGMRVYSFLMRINEPREFKQALRHFWKREWDQALNLANDLISGYPDYYPPRLLAIELKMRLEDFGGAEMALAEIQRDLDVDTVQSIQHDIVLRRRIAERKKGLPTKP